MSRKREQADLIFNLGQLVGPVLHVLGNVNLYDSDDCERVRARFFSDYVQFTTAVSTFTRNERGHVYQSREMAINSVVGGIVKSLRNSYPSRDPSSLRSEIEAKVEYITEVMLSIPVAIDSAIHEAHTPFVWLDRYFDLTIFHRYFVDTPRTAQITLVKKLFTLGGSIKELNKPFTITWPASKFTSAKDKQRYNEFMDISKLFAAERGPPGYRPVTLADFHDRWLRADEQAGLEAREHQTFR